MRVTRDVGDLDRHARRRRCPRGPVPPNVRWSTKRSSRPVVGEAEPHPQVQLVGGVRRPDEQLAAHAEVRQDRLARSRRRGPVTSGQAQPQVLAAAATPTTVRPASRAAKSVGAATCRRTAAGDGPRRTPTARPRPSGRGRAGRPRPRAARAVRTALLSRSVGQLVGGHAAARSRRQAAAAACCSASFLLRPWPCAVLVTGHPGDGGEDLLVVRAGLGDEVLGDAHRGARGELLQAGLPVQAGAEGRGLLDQRVEEPVDQVGGGVEAAGRGRPRRSPPRGCRRGSRPCPGRRWSPRRGRAG